MGYAQKNFAEMVGRLVAPLQADSSVLAQLLSASAERNVRKGDVLLHPSDVPNEVFFVGSGLLRLVTTDAATGTERTAQFFDAGQVFTDPVAFLTHAPSDYAIEAIEPSCVLAIPRAALRVAYDADHAIERLGRVFVEQALIGTHRRASRLLNLSVEDRYETLFRTRPEIAKRLPQYMIASYLGVTPEGLSRIRGRIARAGR